MAPLSTAADAGNLAQQHRARQSDFGEKKTPQPEPLPVSPAPDIGCNAASDRPTIHQGATGKAVSEAQCMLNSAHGKSLTEGGPGLVDAPLVVDGIFGGHTRSTVLSFQQQVFPLTPGEWDGIVGPKTWAALEEAVNGPPLPSFCPVNPGAETGEEGSSFVGGLPGLMPCAPKLSKVAPPVLDEIVVATPGPITVEATMAIKPHMHLGVPVFGPSGVVFTGRMNGGPAAGGEIFFSQVIRKSLREVRIGAGLSTDTITDELDGGPMHKTTTLAVGSGKNVVSETDIPGERQSAQAGDTRFTFHIKDEFELFLMWRADPADPTSKWLSYGSVNWSWDATATGVTTNEPPIWLAPTEAFHLCSVLTSDGSLSIKNHKPQPAAHLGLTVHQPGAKASAPTRAFPSASAKDKLEIGCP